MVAACIVSFGGFADRGLGSLPGGDESELVKGVRACSEAVRPEYDMVLEAGDTDKAALEKKVSGWELVSRPGRSGPWLSGEDVKFPCTLIIFKTGSQLCGSDARPSRHNASLGVVLVCIRPRGGCCRCCCCQWEAMSACSGRRESSQRRAT